MNAEGEESQESIDQGQDLQVNLKPEQSGFKKVLKKEGSFITPEIKK